MWNWYPAAAPSFIQVSPCPGNPVLGFWTLSKQVQWIIFLCTSLLKLFFPVTFYLSLLSFPSFRPQDRILTYPNCNMELKEYYFPWWWICVRGRRQQQRFTASLGQEEARCFSGRTIVIILHAVKEFAEVYQLIHKWSLSVCDNILKKREVELPQSYV